MKKLFSTVFTMTLLSAIGDTNFVVQLNSLWTQKNASNIVAFVDSFQNDNSSADVCVARGIVDMSLLRWRRGATNELHRALSLISSSPTMSEEQKEDISKNLTLLIVGLESIADGVDEPPGRPNPDPNYQSIMLEELHGQFPFYEYLWELAITCHPNE